METAQLREQANKTRQLNWIINTLYAHMARYGYEAMSLPIIEDANLFLIKAGDQVVNQLFTFERHGQQFALRPEFTAAASYYYITHQADSSIVRWQFSGSVFADDPNDTARDHERHSIGAELMGMQGTVADAEIIAMAVQGLEAIGLDDWQLTVGHAGLISQMLARFELDVRTERFLLHQILVLKNTSKVVLDLFDELFLSKASDSLFYEVELSVNSVIAPNGSGQEMMGGRTREEINRRLLQKRKRVLERDRIVEAVSSLEKWGIITGTLDDIVSQLERDIPSSDYQSRAILGKWREMFDLLASYGIPLSRVVLQPDLARSWEYYTGMVFELRVGGEHVGGGGRYDELARLIGGEQDVPAVGFAYYVDQIISALPSSLNFDGEAVTLVFNDASSRSAVRWAGQLRERGLTVRLLPSDAVHPEGKVLVAESGLMVRFNEQTYSLEQIGLLVATLK